MKYGFSLTPYSFYFSFPFSPFSVFSFLLQLKLRQFINKMNDCRSTWLLFTLHPLLTCTCKLMFLLLLFIDVCKGSWSEEQHKQNLLTQLQF